MTMGDVGVVYVKVCQNNLFSSVLVFYVPFTNGRFYVVLFVISVCIPMILPLLKDNSIYYRFIVGIWYFGLVLLYLSELFLLPNQPCHFLENQGGLGSNRRLFLYIWINYILCLVLVWLKGQLCFFLFFKAVRADKVSKKIMNLLWLVVVIWSNAQLREIIWALFMEDMLVILFSFL